ncbi:DNA-packaging protein [Alphaproteobacteria bacterium LSUCC0719]
MTTDTWQSFADAWKRFVASATPQTSEAFLSSLAPGEAERLVHAWSLWARPAQLPPPGRWRVWLLMAGRGFGKTRAGAEWVRQLAETGKAGSIALVGDTADDVRHVMVEGPSGLLAIAPPSRRPQWQRSLRRLEWPNGVVARCYAAVDPEQLRGPEFDHAWADEIGKWPDPAAWDNLMLALRRGAAPRCLATTTPRPRQWLCDLADAPDTILVRGATAENAANLAPGFLDAMTARYGAGPLARQELYGEMINSAPGALWRRDALEICRAPPPQRRDLQRVVVGVDPALGGPGETGIIVVGKDGDGMIWVLEDASAALPPAAWAARVVQCFRRWRAEAVIAEVNQGGALVRSLLNQAGTRLPIREVRAMRSKSRRAEPVAAAYERGEVRHAGMFPVLEDQMCACVPGHRQSPSPDRLDALVWAVNACLGGIETTSRELAF